MLSYGAINFSLVLTLITLPLLLAFLLTLLANRKKLNSNKEEICDLKSALQELNELSFWQLNNLDLGIVIFDAYGQIIFCNEYTTKFLHLEPKEIAKINFNNFFVAELLESGEHVNLFDMGLKLAVNQEFRTRVRLIDADNNRYIIELKVKKFNCNQDEIEFFCQFSNFEDTYIQREEKQIEQQALALMGELTNASYFYYDLSGKVIGKGAGIEDMWMFENGLPISGKRWIYPEDYPDFELKKNALIVGKVDRIEINFRSNYHGDMRYYRMNAIRRAHPLSKTSNLMLGVLQDITSFKQKEIMINNQKAILENTFNILPALFYAKSKGVIELCGNSLCKFLNLTKEQIIGKKSEEIFADSNLEVLLESESRNFEYGSASYSISKLYDHYGVKHNFYFVRTLLKLDDDKELLICVGLNITDLKKSQHELQQQKELLQAILNKLPIGIAIKDAQDDFRYILGNTELERQTKTKISEIIGRNDLEQPLHKSLEQDNRFIDLELVKNHIDFCRQAIYHNCLGEKNYLKLHKSLIELSDQKLIIDSYYDSTSDYLDITKKERVIKLQEEYLEAEVFLRSCLLELETKLDLPESITAFLGKIGKYLKANRCYFMHFQDSFSNLKTPFEWQSPILEHSYVRQIDFTLFPDWLSILKKYRIIYINTEESKNDDFERLRESLRAQELKSVIFVGIFDENNLTGFLGLDFSWVCTMYERGKILALLKKLTIVFEKICSRYDEKSLHNEKSYQQRQILDILPIPILVLNQDFSIAYMNAVTYAYSNQLPGEVTEKKCYELFCTKDLRNNDECLVAKSFTDGLPHHREVQIGGNVYQVNSVPIFHNGKVKQVVECFIDMGKVDFKSKEIAESKNQALKTQISATISHEIRTPLSTIIGFSELLKSDSISKSEQAEYLMAINQAGSKLLHLLHSKLDFSMSDIENVDLEIKEHNMDKIAEELRSFVSMQCDNRQLLFNVNQKDKVPNLFCDIRRIKQVLYNIIDNAIENTPKGHVIVNIRFSSEDQKFGNLIFEVKDSGIGISENKMQEIQKQLQDIDFLKNHLLNAERGIGLSIANWLTRKMNGSLTISSELDLGTTVVIKFNNLEIASQLKPKNHAQPLLTSVDSIHKIQNHQYINNRILVVDNVEMNVQVLVSMLKRLGFECMGAFSGEAGLALMEQYDFQCVITDLWMPQMNGVEFTKIIKSNTKYADVRMLAITADSSYAKSFDVSCFEHVLLKPLTVKLLKDYLLEQ